jgi:hypothetical protein
MLIGIIYAVAAVGGLAWTALAAAAVYVLHYGLCYNKEPGCGAGMLAAVGVMVVYATGIAAGIALTRWLTRRVGCRTK